LYAFDFTGGKLSGYDRDPEVDEYERKEQLRKNRRRPLEETVADVGEGRGESDRPQQNYAHSPLNANEIAIHPPGYEERRRQRLKEKYGIDINPVSVRSD
jgi:hypothetical protein